MLSSSFLLSACHSWQSSVLLTEAHLPHLPAGVHQTGSRRTQEAKKKLETSCNDADRGSAVKEVKAVTMATDYPITWRYSQHYKCHVRYPKKLETTEREERFRLWSVLDSSSLRSEDCGDSRVLTAGVRCMKTLDLVVEQTQSFSCVTYDLTELVTFTSFLKCRPVGWVLVWLMNDNVCCLVFL